MAKDLRSFLEPPRDSTRGKETQSSVPLAHRRGLTSPGEPRVFQVRGGFVCGLCGLVHKKLETAFDCLGRCTVQLRLRTPAGPSQVGSTAHFACSACGRGYANCDDAEQCFERCLVKLKPTKEFESALRRVQVRYAQRLASHGVRQLERIDPFREHTMMLETLTKEQGALNGQTVHSAASDQQKNSSGEVNQVQLRQPASTTVEPKLAVEEPELNSTELAQAPIEEPEPSSTELAQTPIEEPELSSTELAQAPNEESGSALQELLEISSQPEDFVIEESKPQESVAPETHEERAAQNLTNESINDLEMDDLTSLDTPEKETSLQLSLESSEFANFGSEVESQDHSGADALALLQDQPVEVDSAPQENRNSRALVNKNRIDGDLLDELTDTDEDQGALNKVFVRREKMKPYRRDYAKYCCSACSKEFFTQEQVEACFFSHPEEGSEEERLLLEKVAKLSNNTAA